MKRFILLAVLIIFLIACGSRFYFIGKITEANFINDGVNDACWIVKIRGAKGWGAIESVELIIKASKSDAIIIGKIYRIHVKTLGGEPEYYYAKYDVINKYLKKANQ